MGLRWPLAVDEPTVVVFSTRSHLYSPPSSFLFHMLSSLFHSVNGSAVVWGGLEDEEKVWKEQSTYKESLIKP